MKLLSNPQDNPKIFKNSKKGVLTAPLHLAPYNLSGYQTCPMASKGCAAACLNTAGRGGMIKKGETTNRIQEARIRKTKWYFENRSTFLDQLDKDIKSLIRKADREGKEPAVRLNATSDIPWERLGIFEKYPDVQFYDYTAITKRALLWAQGKMPSNYHLTFSAKEDNDDAVKAVAQAKGNIAVVFGKQLPKEYLGLPVIDGDEHDFRPLDPKGCVVGLKAKGKARKDNTGFVKWV